MFDPESNCWDVIKHEVTTDDQQLSGCIDFSFIPEKVLSDVKSDVIYTITKVSGK